MPKAPTPAQRTRLSLRAKHSLWRRGVLDWKLTPNSLGVSQMLDNAPRLSTLVDESSRKVGKSYLGLVKTFEALIRNPGKRSNYACMTGKMASEIVVPLIAQVASDAPPELLPHYSLQTGHITFPEDGPAKGAYAVLFGCEDVLKADRGRGPESVLNVVDEGGFIPVLKYVMTDVLRPQLTHTKGKTLLLSSPPLTPAHHFCVVADAARVRGRYSNRNIYTPGGLFSTAEEIEEYIVSFAEELGVPLELFRKSSTYKREVLGQRAVDESLAVVPEFAQVEHDSTEKHPVTGEDVVLRGIVRPHPRPAGFVHVDRYVSLDPGMSDFSGGLGAYLDFLAGGLVIIDWEFLLARANTRTLAEEVVRKEREVWPSGELDKDGLPIPFKVRLRVVDDPGQRLVADFWGEHKLSFSPATKPDREGAINLLRLVVGSRKMVVLPHCTHTIAQLRNAIRTKPGGDMARQEGAGHFDLVAAAWYLVRDMNRQRNPYPADFGVPDIFHHVGGKQPPPPNPLSQALLGGTSLGRRLLRGPR